MALQKFLYGIGMLVLRLEQGKEHGSATHFPHIGSFKRGKVYDDVAA